MSISCEIQDLDQPYLRDVLGLCKTELGSDYHTKDDFQKFLEDDGRHFCKVVLLPDGRVCGFSTALLVGPGGADQFLKLPDSPQRDQLLSAGKIGIIDAMAIDHHLKRRGIGKQLSSAVYTALAEQGAGVICAMAWKNILGVTNAAKIVEDLGMRPSLEIQGYWNTVVESPEGHHCPVCQEPPCRCYGVLYTRYLD